MHTKIKRQLLVLASLLISLPAIALYMADDFEDWASSNGFGVYWNWVYDPFGGTDLIGAALDPFGDVVEDAYFDGDTGEYYDGQPYTTPVDFDEWYDENIDWDSGSGSGGGGSGGDTGGGGSGGGSCLLPGCFTHTGIETEKKRMNAILLLAATYPLMTSSLEEVDLVSRQKAAQAYVSQVLKGGHVHAFQSLTAIARSSGRDQDMESILKRRIDEEVTEPKIENLASNMLSRADIRCSMYACELSYEPTQRINMFTEKNALIDLVKATSGFDSLDVTPSVSKPGNTSVLHVFFLRSRFFEYFNENAENSGRPD